MHSQVIAGKGHGQHDQSAHKREEPSDGKLSAVGRNRLFFLLRSVCPQKSAQRPPHGRRPAGVSAGKGIAPGSRKGRAYRHDPRISDPGSLHPALPLRILIPGTGHRHVKGHQPARAFIHAPVDERKRQKRDDLLAKGRSPHHKRVQHAAGQFS